MRYTFHARLKTQSIIALVLLWLGGFILLIYLFFIFENPGKSKAFTMPAVIENVLSKSKKADTLSNTQNINDTLLSNDAFVFVNVNKKRFLTKFVAISPEEDSGVTITQKNTTSKISPVERVNKLTKNKPSKKSTDFSIKPAPEL